MKGAVGGRGERGLKGKEGGGGGGGAEEGGREVNRRRGRCSSLGCLCANNYADEIRRERHETPRKRRPVWEIPHDAEGRGKNVETKIHFSTS